MNRYTIQIGASAFLSLLPIFYYLYWEWDRQRPRTGAVGDGIIEGPNGYEISILISFSLMGVLQLILSIHRYLEYQKSLQNDKEQ